MVTWQQFCNLIADRFTDANAHEAVEMLQNIRQTHTIAAYIDKFEECVSLVKRDHPYLQESFLLSCYIGGLKPEVKHDVAGQRPNSLLECYWYSKIYEKAANSKRMLTAAPAYRQRFQQQQQLQPWNKSQPAPVITQPQTTGPVNPAARGTKRLLVLQSTMEQAT